MRVIQSQPGWHAIIATPDKNNPIGFQVAKYPLVGWEINDRNAYPILPDKILKKHFKAPMDPNGTLFDFGKQFTSVEAWIECIETQYEGHL